MVILNYSFEGNTIASLLAKYQIINNWQDEIYKYTVLDLHFSNHSENVFQNETNMDKYLGVF